MVKETITKVDLITKRIKSTLETVAVESCINVYINDKYYATFLASPTMEKELVIGHMLSEGLIRSIDDLKTIHISKGMAKVKLREGVKLRLKPMKVKLFTSTQASPCDLFKTLGELNKPLVSSDLKIRTNDILEMIDKLNRKSVVYKATRGVHSAALFSRNIELVSFSEDVARHNAVDKVIGDAALRHHDFSKSILISSGRQSAHMILKAARVRIPIVASVASPIYSGVVCAKKAGITLISVPSKRCVKIYTFPERII